MSDQGESRPQITLDYAAASSKRRKYLKRIAALVLSIAIGVAAYRWGRVVRDHIVLLYVQHQCMTYAPPSDMIVYEEDPLVAAKLLGSSPDYYPSPVRRKLSDQIPTHSKAAAYVPPFWPRLGITTSGMITTGTTPAVIFLHERVSPSGHRRLVRVHYWSEANTFQPQLIDGYNCDSMAIKPATAYAACNAAQKFWVLDVLSGWPKHPPNVRIFAGQIDANDASKFTIAYEMWGQRDIIDGQLGDDDRVMLTQRKIPQEVR